MSTAATNAEQQPQESLLLVFLKLLVFIASFFISLLTSRILNKIYENPNPSKVVSSTTTLAANKSSSMLSLPDDIVLNCLARVPKREDTVLSCVSKRFQSLVLSPDIAQMRSLLGKRDYPLLYLCFIDTTLFGWDQEFHWFTFNPNEKKAVDQLSSIPLFSQPGLYCSTVSIGSKIYFIGGVSYCSCPGLWKFDSLSGKFCRCPSMRVPRNTPGVALVDGKIYVMGGCRENQIQVEVFEPKTQSWEVGPINPHGEVRYGRGYMGRGAIVTEAVAVDGKVYCMSYDRNHIVYGTKDGTCETFEMANELTWRRGGVCVIDNVIYVYYTDLGLMWYDSKEKVWRSVKGLKVGNKSINMVVGMADCNGKLAFLWEDCSNIGDTTKKKIWFAMIVLDKSGVEIHATVEWSDLLGSVPRKYSIWRCLSVSP